MSARKKIIELVNQHYIEEFPDNKFIPGESPVPVSGRTFDQKDIETLIDSSLDFWLTEGRYTDLFEKKFSDFLNVKKTVPVNSGSSANLLALSSLTSPKLKDHALKKGDEVITVATGFPTTINPIIQNGCVPVYLDCELDTYNINTDYLSDALSKKTKAVMIAHTLGNPFNIDEISKFCKENDLFLIEDSCDALGSKYKGKYTGTFGDMGTFSYYPAHHITMGEGGSVVTNNSVIFRILESFRDWGRDCWCPPGKSDTCNRRYDWQLGNLPYGYDHKYTYSHIGYNFKLTDLQASIGCSQLDKLDDFIEKRKNNWQRLYSGLSNLEEFFILPKKQKNSDPSWFGFALTVRDSAPFSRPELINHLDNNNINSRFIFGGNILWQPAYQNTTYREVGSLTNSNTVALSSFWLGVFPGLTIQMIDFVIETIQDFAKNKKNKV
jgi:CDP-6-deoxy-D-xylo-4-hexulose-3-dehydrase